MVRIDEVQAELRRTGDAEALDDLSGAAMDPVVALQAVTGMKAESLLYQFNVAGAPVVGFTVKGAKTLAARRGGFEVHEPRVEDVVIPVDTSDGTWVDVPAVRATVRVTDKRNDTTFVASVTRPRVKVLKDGSHRLDQHTEANAVARATRNAIMDHFSGVADVVKHFVVEAQKQGKVYVIGEADAQAEEVSRAISTQQARRKAMRSAPVGKMGAGLFRVKVEAAEQEGGIEKGRLVQDLVSFMKSRWGDLTLDQVPISDMGILEGWLQEKRMQLGLDVDEQEAEEAVTEEADLAANAPDDAPPSEPQPEKKPAPAKAKQAKPTKPAETPNGNGGRKAQMDDDQEAMF
jgi:hypothetical protein